MTTITIPTLETERLILRAPRIEDFDTCRTFITSERSHFVGGPVDDDRQAWRAFAHISSMWLLRGAGIFVLERRDTGTIVGGAGPWEPVSWPEPELSWAVWNPSEEGKGFITEAMKRILPWVWDDLGWETCVSYVDPDNHRSAAVARRLGAVIDPDAAVPAGEEDEPLHVWRHRKGTRA
ncbi:RimJ/RimL family protein N-acetyltransferase [Aliiruegeria haliotis]|uniref:RimJ/RimL family protein N-acetyltransferase n=1 Tax=Aliiruegeria haliotis TaxID=1280846 RepID=A0A2T0RR72_9RHOB|nr:GNAT family N-acetyltransferase [Aliiruegeria haliotis]PRY23696.1 RimJ/RimL family protein N-acetyltransferase [Aliiruegeria haliotis]